VLADSPANKYDVPVVVPSKEPFRYPLVEVEFVAFVKFKVIELDVEEDVMFVTEPIFTPYAVFEAELAAEVPLAFVAVTVKV
jgi:hypothetical protein